MVQLNRFADCFFFRFGRSNGLADDQISESAKNDTCRISWLAHAVYVPVFVRFGGELNGHDIARFDYGWSCFGRPFDFVTKRSSRSVDASVAFDITVELGGCD